MERKPPLRESVWPSGALRAHPGVQFVVFSRSATRCGCCSTTRVRRPRAGRDHRVRPRHRPLGRHLEHLRSRHRRGQLYHFQADGPFDPERGQRSTAKARLIDPYAKALAGDFQPRRRHHPAAQVRGGRRLFRLGRRPPPARRSRDGHLRDARPRLHAASRPAASSIPGTYLGVIEKIPYLKSLGVTAVELMPVHEFPIRMHSGPDARAAQLLGLRSAGVLRAAPRLRRRRASRAPGERVQADGQGPARRRASK
jgi:isoamylase